jgi:hypothetical protein
MPSQRLKILVLHRLGDPRSWRTSMAEHELCLPRNAPAHDYIVHNAALPLPDFVRDIDFDGIVLCQTFLSLRRDPPSFRRTLASYDFIARSRAFKIALPQDDYDCSSILDRWLCDWKVDLAYPVCSEHWDVLYPRFGAQGRLRQGYTGYISQQMRERWTNPKPHAARRIDVSYRAARLSPNFGRLGYLKSVIGERFVRAARGRGLVLDISTDPRDTIVGGRWHDFIEDSRCVLGVNSGSSVLDPDGSINLRVYDYVVRRPQAPFEEVEAACFPGVDGQYVFTAISPRNLECGLIESVQILTPGAYSGMLQAGAHYIPMEPDLSNAAEIFTTMSDAGQMARIARACKETLLSQPALRVEHHVAEQIGEIAAAARSSTTDRQLALFERYREHMKRIEPSHWRRARTLGAVHRTLVAMGARRVKRALLQRAWGR